MASGRPMRDYVAEAVLAEQELARWRSAQDPEHYLRSKGLTPEKLEALKALLPVSTETIDELDALAQPNDTSEAMSDDELLAALSEFTGHTRCPRCNIFDPRYPRYPALSRYDNITDVCPTCGEDEAFIQAGVVEGELTGPEDWPVRWSDLAIKLREAEKEFLATFEPGATPKSDGWDEGE